MHDSHDYQVVKQTHSLNSIDEGNGFVKEKIPPTYQFRALSRKNASLQSKQCCSNLCQIAVPLLLVSLAGGFQLLFNYYVISTFDAGNQVMTSPSYVTFNEGLYRSTEYALWHSEETWTPVIGNLTETGGKQGLLGNIPQILNTTNPDTYSPWFEYYPGEQAMIDDLDELKQYWVQRQLASLRYPHCLTCPEAAVIFNSVAPGATPTDASTIDYQILIDTQTGYTPFQVESTMLNMMNSAFIRQATQNINWVIGTWVQQLPYIEQAPFFDIGSFLGLLLYPFAVSFVMAIYVNAIVVEKQERLREMMRMNGMKMYWYWIVNYIWDIFLYALIIISMILTSVAFGLRMFTQTSPVIWIVILVGWGNCQVALGFVLSTLFDKARTATIVSYLLVIAGVVFSYVLNATVFKEESDNPAVYIMVFLYPPFACYRAIYLIGAGCTILECPQIQEIQIGGELFYIMIFLYVDIFIYFAIALYLDAVIPREFGVAKSPLFPIKALIRYIQQKRRGPSTDLEEQRLVMSMSSSSSTTANDAPTSLPNFSKDELGDENEVDPDVLAEEQRIKEHRIPADSPIIIQELRKIYKAKPGTPEKIAVQSLSLHIEKGECFGLLGPNGAGKTTSISILTGLFPPSSGNALIGGFSILDSMDSIHRIMSVCPQFDTLWMELTCIETLLFYARLKGIPSKEEKHHVNDILEKVGLIQYGKRKAKDLSGGMRRRLSIGISLIGDPKVVFLDEPTTGLDPETRRHLWDVLLLVKQGRSIILTTHSMEEADIICSRIGIMSRGRLRCIGTQLHLKKKFGAGYTLHVNFAPENEARVVRFVEDTLPGATMVENFAGNCIFQMDKQQIVVSDVFEAMESRKLEVGIQDWGISQTTMEDVFIRIARRDEADEEMMNAT